MLINVLIAHFLLICVIAILIYIIFARWEEF